MRAGKQTATETELLNLLEEARERVPQIRRYAQDSPQNFLKRVELRSSLVVEAGRQKEGANTVPFYQFRHLTFQEYLAAVAAAEGHYIDYDKADSVLTPLKSYLVAEEWKEIIPMSAVLARKQAEPLMKALVHEGSVLPESWRLRNTNRRRIAAPISRLVQCLAEEAEAAPETLAAAIQLIALHAMGCRSEDDWPALCRGPYGHELLHQAWLIYKSKSWRSEEWLLNTCARFAVLHRPDGYWVSGDGMAELKRMLESESDDEIGRALLAYCGVFFSEPRLGSLRSRALKRLFERSIFRSERYLHEPAMWAWTLHHRHLPLPQPAQPELLNRLMSLWLANAREEDDSMAAFALSGEIGLRRNSWKPLLTEEQRELVRMPTNNTYDQIASCVVAFHDGSVWSEEELEGRLVKISEEGSYGNADRRKRITLMLEQMRVDRRIVKSLGAGRA